MSVKVLVVDGSHLIHRVMHVAAYTGLRRMDGELSGGVFGFFKTLATALTKRGPNSCIVVWDGGRSRRRTEIHPAYKEREVDLDLKEKIIRQADIVKGALPLFGIPTVEIPGKEADDIIAFICNQVRGVDFTVMSEDKDFYQLVSPSVNIYRPISDKLISPENFQMEVKCREVHHYLFMKAILGDSSDNIDKVPRIGDTSVEKLFSLIRGNLTLDKLISYALTNDSKRVHVIGEYKTIISRNMELMDLTLESFSKSDITSLYRSMNYALKFSDVGIMPFLRTWELDSLVNSFVTWSPAFTQLQPLKEISRWK